MRKESEFSRSTKWCPEPGLWLTDNAMTAGLEVGDFMYALVRLLKPKLVVEVGCGYGLVLRRMADALGVNGRGEAIGIEPDRACADGALALLAGSAKIVCAPVLQWTPDRPIDLLFVDCGPETIRGDVVLGLEPWIAGTVVLDDAGQNHQTGVMVRERLKAWRQVIFPTPRGLAIVQKPDPT